MIRIKDLSEKWCQSLGELPWDTWVVIETNDAYPYKMRLSNLTSLIAKHTMETQMPQMQEAVLRKVTERIACLEAELAAEKAKNGQHKSHER